MVIRVVGDAIVHTEVNEGWAVTSLECTRGLARLDLRRDLTQVVIADTGDAEAGLGEPPAFAAAACTPDGEVVVVARRSPPAIVLGPSGCRTSPSNGADRETAYPQPGERLLLLSSSAFENMSDVLVSGMNVSPSALIQRDPQDLLLAIFADLGCGAGAVIDRRPNRLPEGVGP